MSVDDGSDGFFQLCEHCGRETSHWVRVEIRTESKTAANPAFSREPYRISVCSQCGEEEALRMNNA